MAKIGRNDPCSCGSGKKYKKCVYSGEIGHAFQSKPAGDSGEIGHAFQSKPAGDSSGKRPLIPVKSATLSERSDARIFTFTFLFLMVSSN